MTNITAFLVPGPAMPQGSKVYKGHRNGKPVLVESSKRLAPWRNQVRLVAGLAHQGDPWDGPVSVDVAFDFKRGPSHLLTDGISLSSYGRRYPFPSGKADIDKACRALLDALTGIVYLDDDQVVALTATKGWGPVAQTRVAVRPLRGVEWRAAA